MTKLLAYHNDVKIKEKILNQLQEHYESDEIVQGIYWENGKGCAVGCTIHSSNHKEYETKFGIPVQLAYLEDKIFEGLPNDLSKEWPIRFMSSINVGADLSKVWAKFVIWLLEYKKDGVIKYANTDEHKIIIRTVAELYKKSLTEEVNEKEFIDASDLYVSRDYDSPAAIRYSYAAGSASAASSARTDAYDTSYASTYAANAAVFADRTEVAASESAFIKQSEKLIELLKDCH